MGASYSSNAAQTAPTKPEGTRVIVTGNNADGKSYVVSDENVTESDPFCLLEATKETPLGDLPGDMVLPNHPNHLQIAPEDGGCKVLNSECQRVRTGSYSLLKGVRSICFSQYGGSRRETRHLAYGIARRRLTSWSSSLMRGS